MSLQLFDVPDVDYRYEASREVEFQPALTGIQPITFSIPGSDDYYDTNSLRFKVKVRLTNPAAGYTGLDAGLLISNANESRHVQTRFFLRRDYSSELIFSSELVQF